MYDKCGLDTMTFDTEVRIQLLYVIACVLTYVHYLLCITRVQVCLSVVNSLDWLFIFVQLNSINFHCKIIFSWITYTQENISTTKI